MPSSVREQLGQLSAVPASEFVVVSDHIEFVRGGDLHEPADIRPRRRAPHAVGLGEQRSLVQPKQRDTEAVSAIRSMA